MNQIPLADYRQQVEDAIENRRHNEALAHGRHIVKRFPKDIQAYWLLGKAMLEADQDAQAVDMFQRVLSADPEHVRAWIGMSRIAGRQGELEDALGYLQLAFELAPEDKMVAQGLRHLYRELDGSDTEQLQLSESGLARLHLRSDLLQRAITELRRLIEEHPDRVDLKAALIEALWRNGQRLQAAQVCHEILEEQPYNLKANLILGQVWSSSGRTAEGQPYLRRAQALDPGNEVARELFGPASPLEPIEPLITPLTYGTEAGEEQMDWMMKLEEALPTPAEEVMVAKMKPPAWLRKLMGESGTDTGAEPEETSSEIEGEREAAPPVEPSAPEEPLPEEKTDDRVAAEEIAPERMQEEDVLAWLSKLEQEDVAPRTDRTIEQEELPAWLTEVDISAEEIYREEGGAPEEQQSQAVEIPDWLRDLAPPAAESLDSASPESPEVDSVEEAVVEKATPEQPAAEASEQEVPSAEEAAIEELRGLSTPSSWLKTDELPSGDDALAWLAQLAAGDEEKLPTKTETEAEGEARLAEIAGGPELTAEEEAEMKEPQVGAPYSEEEGSPIEEVEGPEPEGAPTSEEITLPVEPMEGVRPAAEPQPKDVKASEPEAGPEPPIAAELSVTERVSLAELGEETSAKDLDRFIADQREYAEDHPDDHEAQLELGRLLWQAERREDAVEAYERLIGSDELLDEVIADLEDYTEQWEDARLLQALGDAYRETDQLEEALDTYRQALASL